MAAAVSILIDVLAAIGAAVLAWLAIAAAALAFLRHEVRKARRLEAQMEQWGADWEREEHEKREREL